MKNETAETYSKSRLLAAVAANGAIFILELVALILSFSDWSVSYLQYYTRDSNYLALIASALFVIYAIRQLTGGAVIPKWVYTLRYVATCCLAQTLLVVLFVLIPMYGFEQAGGILFGGTMLYHHLLCPVFAILSLLLFERTVFEKRLVWVALSPTIAYALITTTLNITKTLHGPYPFLYVYEQPIWMSFIWFFVILGIALLIAWLLWLAKRGRVR